jgi:hypothetical protein
MNNINNIRENEFCSAFGYTDIATDGDIREGISYMQQNNQINRYIDSCLIDEYANNYTLDVEHLPAHERTDFLDYLMEHDNVIRDIVHFHMQGLINKRLLECKEKNYSSNIRSLYESA